MSALPGLPFNIQSMLDTGRLEFTPLPGDGGLAFLQTLLDTLPPEVQSLSPEELQRWLEDNAGLLGEVPMPVPVPVPVEVADGPKQPVGGEQADADPARLLQQLISARSQSTAAGEQDRLVTNTTRLVAEAAESVTEPEPEFSLNLAGASRATAPTPQPAEVPEMQLRTPVQHPDFGKALGERLTWLVRQNVQHARIQLDPANLGPLDIALAVKDDHASVTITAQHATTREVLEQDVARLRSMLTENGFGSVDVNVARDQGRQNEAWREQLAESGPGRQNLQADAGEAEEQAGRVLSQGRGLVDHYA